MYMTCIHTLPVSIDVSIFLCKSYRFGEGPRFWPRDAPPRPPGPPRPRPRPRCRQQPLPWPPATRAVPGLARLALNIKEYVHISKCICICIYNYVYAYIYVYVAYIYICTYVHVYMHRKAGLPLATIITIIITNIIIIIIIIIVNITIVIIIVFVGSFSEAPLCRKSRGPAKHDGFCSGKLGANKEEMF